MDARSTRQVRRASGLPEVAVLRDPCRTRSAVALLTRSDGDPLLASLVDLAASVSASTSAQLALLTDEHVVVAGGGRVRPRVGDCDPLECSLCSVTVLSGDVLVAADTRSHPWLRDLPPVVRGDVGAYLGVPLPVCDGSLVGALCVYGREPREWSDRDVVLVCQVADAAALHLQAV